MSLPQPSDRHVVIVDDDPINLEQLEVMVRDLGYRCTALEDGETALSLFTAAGHAPDLLMTDIRMPKIDGFTLLQRMHKIDERIPIVLVTAHGDIETALRALRIDAFDVLLKPFTPADVALVFKRLQTCWEKRRSFHTLVAGEFSANLSLVIPTQRKLTRLIAQTVREQFREDLRQAGVDINRFTVAVLEALENAMVHGNLGLGSEAREGSMGNFEEIVSRREADPAYGERLVNINAILTRGLLEVAVTDQGAGFDHEALPKVADAASLMNSGRGIFVIRSVMDSVSWELGGARIRMQLRLDRRPAPVIRPANDS